MKHFIALSVGLLLSLLLFGCSDHNNVPANAPPAPVELTATGALGAITLDWGNSIDYTRAAIRFNVYRRVGNGTPVRRTASPITEAHYIDTITSPDGDGVLYTYYVTAVAQGVESGPSDTVTEVHGTRVPANNPSGFTADFSFSPYVVEGTVTVDDGNFMIPTGCKVYLKDDATIDMPENPAGSSTAGQLRVIGLLRVLASSSHPANITAHKTGGLGADEGFTLNFVNAVSYDPIDGSGTLIKNCWINNLKQGHGTTLEIANCAPRFSNSYIIFNTDQACTLMFPTGVIVDHCYIANACPRVTSDQSASGFTFSNNIVRPNDANYCLEFVNSTTTPIASGAIAGNDFDGVTVDLSVMTGAYTIPLGGNYWRGGTGTPPAPSIRRQNDSTCEVDFDTALNAAPAGVGPDWILL